MGRRTTSQRTCAGTRSVEHRDQLVRWFIGPDGTPWPDWTGRSARMSGRGAWTLPTDDAVRKASERGGFARAFRGRSGRTPSGALIERMAAAGKRVFFERLALANRAGAIAIGQKAVSERVMVSGAGLLLLATDAGAAARSKFSANARRKSIEMIGIVSGAALGAPLGREFVSVAFVEGDAFVEDLRRWAGPLTVLPNTGVVEYDAAAPVLEIGTVTAVRAETLESPGSGTA